MKGDIDRALATAGEILLGKERELRVAFACLFARGHLLIEDVPGVGKTLLAQTLSRILGLRFQRIQFTSDLLPADILGVSIFDRGAGAFRFHPGPIFTQVLMADEINRATPKAQSALLEAMEERQVTVEGDTRPLPEPFFVVATQNPVTQTGTFPLPESQRDRFLMCLRLGYPGAAAERALLEGRDRREMLAGTPPVLTPEKLSEIQGAVPRVYTSPALLDYIQALLRFTRESPEYRQGLSPRAGLALLRSAQAVALLEGRDRVLPEDVQTVLPPVVVHRLVSVHPGTGTEEDASATLLESVPVP